ncbi:hypothetical protein B0H17DRAFT_1108073, partial [Mycena rosella]
MRAGRRRRPRRAPASRARRRRGALSPSSTRTRTRGRAVGGARVARAALSGVRGSSSASAASPSPPGASSLPASPRPSASRRSGERRFDEERACAREEDERVGRGGAAPGRIGRVYELGSFAGLWAGKMLMPSEPPYTFLLSAPGGAFPRGGLARHDFVAAARPVYMRIAEHHSCVSPLHTLRRRSPCPSPSFA